MIDSIILARFCGNPENTEDYTVGGVDGKECFYKGKFIGTMEVVENAHSLSVIFTPTIRIKEISLEISYDGSKNLHITTLDKQREKFIDFAKFAKSYQSNRKVEEAWEQWVKKQMDIIKH